MPQFNKWFDRVPADATVQGALQTLWSQRYRATAFYLRQLKQEKSPKIETVHQLRVWSRRTTAVIDLFGPAKPEGPWKKLRKHLKKIRKHADDVRDYDVLWDEVRKSKALNKDFKETWKRRRRAARKRLAEAAHAKGFLKDGDKRLKHEGEAILKLHEASRKMPFRNLAKRQVLIAARNWLKQGKTNLKQPAEMHQFRIEGKRLRYALEITAGVFPKEQVSRLYAELNTLHNELGELCDIRAAVERFEGLYEEAHSDLRKPLAGLIRRERRRLSAGLKAFLKHWNAAARKKWGADFKRLLKA